MAEAKARRSTKPKASGSAYLDLNLRFRDDGGSVFAMLSSIADPHARGDRVRQLLCLGLMVERGALAPMAALPHAVAPQRIVSGPAANDVSAPGSSAVASMASDVSDPNFEPDDLTAIFGSGPKIGG